MTAEAVLTNADETTATPAMLLAMIRAAKSGDQGAFEELMIATERRVSLKLEKRHVGYFIIQRWIRSIGCR